MCACVCACTCAYLKGYVPFAVHFSCLPVKASIMSPSMFCLLFLLPAFTLSEVTTFTKCPQFFAAGIPPTVLHDPADNNRYKQICQCLLDQNERPQYFYATLYDTKNKIPVYSAYEFRRADVDRVDRWYVEPQVRTWVENMISFSPRKSANMVGMLPSTLLF